MAWYPPDANVPAELRTTRLWLRPLGVADTERDYDAVMNSAVQLRLWSQSTWPAHDFTLDQNQADLERHEREHHAREAFTYTVLSPDGSRCLGCVYLNPLPPVVSLCPSSDVATLIRFWVRSSELGDGLDEHLLDALRGWFAKAWSFACTVFMANPQDLRQIALLRAIGLQEQPLTLPDGRTFWLFAEQQGADYPAAK